MGRPKTNMQLATTCEKCGCRVLTAYNIHTDAECSLNQSQNKIDELKLRRVCIDADLAELLTTDHNLPFLTVKMDTENGHIRGVYAPVWLMNAIDLYHSMHFDGMSMGEFLLTMAE